MTENILRSKKVYELFLMAKSVVTSVLFLSTCDLLSVHGSVFLDGRMEGSWNCKLPWRDQLGGWPNYVGDLTSPSEEEVL